MHTSPKSRNSNNLSRYNSRLNNRDLYYVQQRARSFYNNLRNKSYCIYYIGKNNKLNKIEFEIESKSFFHLIGIKPRRQNLKADSVVLELAEENSNLHPTVLSSDFLFTHNRDVFRKKMDAAAFLFEEEHPFKNIGISKLKNFQIDYFVGSENKMMGITKKAEADGNVACSIYKENINKICDKNRHYKIQLVLSKEPNQNYSLCSFNQEITKTELRTIFKELKSENKLSMLSNKQWSELLALSSKNDQIKKNEAKQNQVNAYFSTLLDENKPEEMSAMKEIWLNSDKELSLEELKQKYQEDIEQKSKEKIIQENKKLNISAEELHKCFSNYKYEENGIGIYGNTKLKNKEVSQILNKTENQCFKKHNSISVNDKQNNVEILFFNNFELVERKEIAHSRNNYAKPERDAVRDSFQCGKKNNKQPELIEKGR